MDQLLRVLKSAAEKSRIRLLVLCSQGEFTVTELVRIIGQSQPRVSRHLKILCDAGLLNRTRLGSWVFYSTEKIGTEGEFVRYLVTLIPAEDPMLILDQQRLEKLKSDRAKAAAHFFEKTASKWDAIRAHYVEDINVEKALEANVLAAKPESLLDIGTGTGRILTVLASHVKHAEGIDFSHEMLNLARTNLDQPSLGHCRVRYGDMNQLPYNNQSFAFITVHHVLHFADQPLQVLREAARVLRDKGQIAIVDFDTHEKEEFRIKFHHHRLGFSTGEIENWFQQVGLNMLSPIRIDGDPMAVVIWTGVKANSLHWVKGN